ncbi:hypothetical protein PILCRDRAFT_6833 [Piloderma croceum F 1598]|uniref:Uncharacterized protein n=1 Tax=Piloderma croceum (strain F 1598) TaxID=765440 RepID=A0A0C3FWQ7_PILCF|nr:hypothetical protein PILCRDRAFT_6833 [Piloderma croceum F 1598]
MFFWGWKPAPGEAPPFTSRSVIFRNENDTKQFNSFCNSNRARETKIKAMREAMQTQHFREKPSAHEIIIAPISIPIKGLSCGIVPSILGYHQQLLQIGFLF